MKIIFFLILSLGIQAYSYQLTTPVTAANLLSHSCQSSLFGENVDDTEEVMKKSLSSDIGKFCEETAWGGVAYISEFDARSSVWSDSSTEPNVEAIKKIVRENGTETVTPNWSSWAQSLIPDVEVRGAIFESCEKFFRGEFVYCRSIPQMRQEIKKSREREHGSGTDLTMGSSANFDAGLASSGVVRTAVCTDVTVMRAADCGAALGNIIDYAKPNSENITAMPSYREIFENEKYIAGAKRAALLILDRFEKKKVPEGANLFDDVRDSYQKEGMSKKEAEDAAWEVMAVLASGGPNTSGRMNYFSSLSQFQGMKVAISAISLAIPKLDAMTKKSGHPYSMPKSVTTNCDIGKPYHFWMTAYLARRMKQKNGHSSMGAAAAAYLGQKAYEIKSSTAGRDPNRAFTTEAFGAWNNIMRVDTAFSSAAAVYGANAADGHETEMNIDEGLKVIIESGKILPKLSQAEARDLWTEQFGRKAYNRWQEIIGSDNAFEFHAQKLKD